MDRNYVIVTLLQNTFILRRGRIVIFTDIIKVVSMFIKTILKDSNKIKIIDIMP